MLKSASHLKGALFCFGEELITMNITKTCCLSFYNDQGILTLNAKQFDTGRRFIFHIMDNDEPFELSGCKAYLRIAKADGTEFLGQECCTINGSEITINPAVGNGSQILTAAGTNICELHLEDADGTTLTTWNFNINVEKRVHNGTNMSSVDSYDVIDNIIKMEKDRIANENIRKENEAKRIENEANRQTTFTQSINKVNTTISNCELVINRATNKIENFDNEINQIVDGITDRAEGFATTASICAFKAKESEINAEISQKSAATSASIAAYNVLEAESWAHGKTGIRQDEDIDNSEFYCQQSKSYKNESKNLLEAAKELLEEATRKIINVNFEITDDGELIYEPDIYDFEINDDGELEYWLIEGSNE